MQHHLWLTFETVPHPEAVTYPATVEEAAFVLKLLGLPHSERSRLAQQFRNFLEKEKSVSPLLRTTVPCREPAGNIQLIPWRLAKWLANVLPAEGSVMLETRMRIANWMNNSRKNSVVKSSGHS